MRIINLNYLNTGEMELVPQLTEQCGIYMKKILPGNYIRYGGIGYYHVPDTYIALFSHFTLCSVWEGVYILDFLMKNRSEIQPDTLHADTQGQNAPVFGLVRQKLFLLLVMFMKQLSTEEMCIFMIS